MTKARICINNNFVEKKKEKRKQLILTVDLFAQLVKNSIDVIDIINFIGHLYP